MNSFDGSEAIEKLYEIDKNQKSCYCQCPDLYYGPMASITKSKVVLIGRRLKIMLCQASHTESDYSLWLAQASGQSRFSD